MALSVKNMLGGSGGGASPFAWGKYEYTTTHGNVKFAYVSYASNVYTMSVSSTDIDVSILEAKDFVGIVVPYTNNSRNFTWTFKENNVVTLEDLTNPYKNDYTYEYNSPNILIQGNIGSGGSYGTTTYPISHSDIGNFLEYVTDKNPLKYPNGEVADDGFFYRYANEGLYMWLKKIKSTALSVMNKQLTDIPYSYVYGSAVVYDDEIHILGSSNNYKYHYKFDGAEWTSVSTLPYNFYQASAVVWNNEIHILGTNVSGYTRNHYKWDGTSWTSVSTLPTDFYTGSAVVYNNEIHILGGGNSTIHYKFDGAEWTSVSTLPYYFNLGSAVVYDNEIHILGSSYSSNYAKHYKFDGAEWASVSTLPYNFYQASALALDDGIHIYGSNNNATTRTYHYKWNGTSWTSVSVLPYEYYRGSAIEFNGESYILGGNGASKAYLIDGFGWDDFDAIVSDDDKAYPDRAEQGGYYYEKLGGVEPFKKTSSGTYTVASTISDYQLASVKIPHGLGITPKYAMVFLDSSIDKASMGSQYYYYPVAYIYDNYTFSTNINQQNYVYMVMKNGNTEQKYGISAYEASDRLDDTNIKLAQMYQYAGNSSTQQPYGGYQYLLAGTTYHWIVFV